MGKGKKRSETSKKGERKLTSCISSRATSLSLSLSPELMSPLFSRVNSLARLPADSPVGINQLQLLLSTIVCDAVLDEDVEAGCRGERREAVRHTN